MRNVLVGLLLLSLGACCPKQTPTCPRASGSTGAQGAVPSKGPLIPSFPLAALKGEHAKRVKLYLSADGGLRKISVYVAREAIPAWVHTVADKHLGTGKGTEFEVEQYRDGATVYEVTRLVGGKRIELSVDSQSRALRYLERKGLPLTSIPLKVKQAAAAIAGFTPRSYSLKEHPDRKVHELTGVRSGRTYKLYVRDDGSIQTRYYELPGSVRYQR